MRVCGFASGERLDALVSARSFLPLSLCLFLSLRFLSVTVFFLSVCSPYFYLCMYINICVCLGFFCVDSSVFLHPVPLSTPPALARVRHHTLLF